jgi:cleavage and polyadenylation specificity factor subunit 5
MDSEWSSEDLQSVYFGPAVSLHPVTAYKFGLTSQRAELSSAAERQQQLEERHQTQGQQRTVSAVLLTHQHGHPHVLLIKSRNDQSAKSSSRRRSEDGVFSTPFSLPGGVLEPGESEGEGLRRLLFETVCPNNAVGRAQAKSWEVHGLLGEWWRARFGSAHLYPYRPPHVARPVEKRKVFLVLLSETATLAVAQGIEIVAVPLMMLHRNEAEYGPILAGLPSSLSRFTLHCA